jgi:hypothetical protein
MIADEREMSMTFGEALVVLKKGGNVSRSGWNGEGLYLEFIGEKEYTIPADNTSTRYDNRLPWIAMFTARGEWVPWVASQTDLLSDDWE